MSEPIDLQNANYQQTIAYGSDYWLSHAMSVIEATYGDTVSVIKKDKDLLKFGESRQVQTTKTTLMGLPTGTYNETYVSDNLITHFASSSGSDTENIVVEGHTIDGSGNFTFVTQEVTLAGQTKTALTTPLARCTRIYNNGSTELVGTVYVAQDVTFTSGVPQVDSAVHCIIEAGKQNSNKSSTTISNNDYWILTGFEASWLEKGAGFAEVHLEIRLKGKVFREVSHIPVSDGNPHGVQRFLPYVIVPANADVRLRAEASAAGKFVGGEIQGVLAKVV